jgi:hypothetical protein
MVNHSILIDNVRKRFLQIPNKVRMSPYFGSARRYLGARNPGVIPLPDYTSSIENELGLGEHFQGIQRIGQFLIISGGVKTGLRRSQLILIKMESQPPNGPWALPDYGSDYKNPSSLDRIVKVKDIDCPKWHAGGIQALGSIVAVPVYGDKKGSEVRFFTLDESANDLLPEANLTLVKPASEAKAVALAKLPNGHFMLVTWDDEKLEFHYNPSADFENGFPQHPNAVVNKREIPENFQPGENGIGGGTYQSLNFVVDKTDAANRSKTVYLVAARNSEKASPTIMGIDYLDLYKFEWPNGFKRKPLISLVEHRQIFCYNQQCNFGAGAGIYLDDEQHLFLYGASHWLHGGNSRYNFNEYSYV